MTLPPVPCVPTERATVVWSAGDATERLEMVPPPTRQPLGEPDADGLGTRFRTNQPDVAGPLPAPTPAAPTPEALVAAMAAGSEAALSELYDRLAGAAHALALRILANEADANEVVIDAFAQVWEKAGTFDPAKSSVATWLCMFVRSRSIDRVRSRNSQSVRVESARSALSSQAPAMGRPPALASRMAEIGELRTHIVGALEHISPEQRKAIELAYFAGLSQSQIAERLGEPLGTIKTRIRNGMRRLKERLAPLYADEMA